MPERCAPLELSIGFGCRGYKHPAPPELRHHWSRREPYRVSTVRVFFGFVRYGPKYKPSQLLCAGNLFNSQIISQEVQ